MSSQEHGLARKRRGRLWWNRSISFASERLCFMSSRSLQWLRFMSSRLLQ